jgi:hypothetical protein
MKSLLNLARFSEDLRLHSASHNLHAAGKYVTPPNSFQSTIVNPDSPAVHAYLTMLQAVITRMATNSSSCKTLCITLVSAIIVVIANAGKISFILIGLLPVLLLSLLDAYYLGLEQGFRSTYNEFVKKLHNGEATNKDLFVMIPKSTDSKRFSPIRATAIAFTSFSVYPFYLTLAVIIVLGGWLVPDLPKPPKA